MGASIRRIIVVGGGSAGWLTAGVIAADHLSSTGACIELTVIESPSIGTIGVGEGTWPSMRNTLRRIGISESEFLCRCEASYKQGTKFIGWQDGRSDSVYHHPFTQPEAYGKADLYAGWKHSENGKSFAHTVCVQSHVVDENLAPKPAFNPEYSGPLNYGYHLDAVKLGELLKEHCTEKLNVNYLSDQIINVILDEQGYVTALETSASGSIEGDFFIDCTGARSLLLKEYTGVGFIDKSASSINDKAIAIQVPYLENDSLISSSTIASAQEAGWIWDIGLYSRRGVGYVFSSAHTDEARAESVLREYIARSLGRSRAEELDCKTLAIHAGYLEKFWHKNCVAIGMAAGFIEPLEASALAMVEISAEIISDELPANREVMIPIAKRFNKKLKLRWDGVVDFLKLHYVLSARRDSDYWIDSRATESMSENLQELLAIWQYRPPYFNDFPFKDEAFSSASYQYVLYGMGFQSESYDRQFMSDKALGKSVLASNIFLNNNKVISDLARVLPTNRVLLNWAREDCTDRFVS